MMIYFDLLKRFRIEPNFWMSEPYVKANGWVEIEYGGFHTIRDNMGNIFPVIHEHYGLVFKECWADTEGYPLFNRLYHEKEFLDYEFIYSPEIMLEMKGRSFSAFRRNVRKPEKRYGPLKYLIIDPASTRFYYKYGIPGIQDLVINFLESREDQVVHDFDILVNLHNNKDFWFAIVFLDNDIVGVNVWDDNYRFVNYRYCIVSKEIEFLSEWMRYQFFDSLKALYPDHHYLLANDGGCLGNKGLEKFKRRLQPIAVRERYTWRKQ